MGCCHSSNSNTQKQDCPKLPQENNKNEEEKGRMRPRSIPKGVVENAPEIKINQYTITTILGEGVQTQVRLAVDTDGNRWAAKIARRRITLRRGKKANYLSPEVAREIAILKKLEHPNIVKLHEIMDSEIYQRVFLFIEYVDGGPVMREDLLEGKTTRQLSEPKARNIFAQLIMGLEYLHFHGIVHRDIKPSNLLLTKGGLLKISDFGISAICEPIDPEKMSSSSFSSTSVSHRASRTTTGSASDGDGRSSIHSVSGDKRVSEDLSGLSLGPTTQRTSSNWESFLTDDSKRRSVDLLQSPRPLARSEGSDDMMLVGDDWSDSDTKSHDLEHVPSRNSLSPKEITATIDAKLSTSDKSSQADALDDQSPGSSLLDAIAEVAHNDLMNNPLGTLAFFPPEACNLENFDDVLYKGKVADIWAAGVTLYMLLQGRLPFYAENREELFRAIKFDKLQFPKIISNGATLLLQSILHKDPEQRFGIQSIKQSDWMAKSKIKELSEVAQMTIAPTQLEMDTALTEIDLSVGIVPPARSKSWNESYYSLLSDKPSIRSDSEMEESVSEIRQLRLDTQSVSTTYLGESKGTRPISLPVRQIRDTKLQSILAQQNLPTSQDK